MDILLIPLTTIASLLILFLITRATGNRQISSLSAYDYVNSITLGSIAAQMAVSPDAAFWHHAIAMAVYGIFTFLIAVLTNKHQKLRHLVEGRPIVLMEHGTLYREAFRHAHIDLDEFSASLRSMGYFDLAQIDSAVLETNGRLSVLPYAENRPITPSDFKLDVPEDAMTCCLICDGKLSEEALRRIGRDHKWLNDQLHQAKIGSVKDVFFASFHPDGTVTFFVSGKPQYRHFI